RLVGGAARAVLRVIVLSRSCPCNQDERGNANQEPQRVGRMRLHWKNHLCRLVKGYTIQSKCVSIHRQRPQTYYTALSLHVGQVGNLQADCQSAVPGRCLSSQNLLSSYIP